MAHFTITSENFPEYAYQQSILPWYDPTSNVVCLLSVETPTFRGEKRDEERKSVFLSFDLATAEHLLAELTSAVEQAKDSTKTHAFPVA